MSPGTQLSTTIAEADRDSGVLRYRGVDMASLIGRLHFSQVWGLLVDEALSPGLPPAEPFPLPVRTGDIRVDVQAALAMLAPVWGFRPLLDTSRETARDDLARASSMAMSFIAQSARGPEMPAVPEWEIDQARTVTERFLLRWRGDADPRHVEALDAYWIAIAEHGLNPSSYTARVIASTGADAAACLCGAVGAMSGPLHGGAPRRVLADFHEIEAGTPANAVIAAALADGGRLMGFGHSVYRGPDPRAVVLRETCRRLGAPRYEAALAYEQAGLAALADRSPGRTLGVNVEFWAAVILDLVGVPASMVTPMFVCGRTAGWSAHVLEQQSVRRMIRPTAEYTGPGPRSIDDITP